MSEHPTDLLAEAALGALDEPERGAVLAHAASCLVCRRQLDELVAVADRLLASAPEAEPPPGFEQRVLARLGPTPRRRRAGRWVAVAAVVLLAVGVATGVAIAPDPSGPAPLRTADGDVVGSFELAGDADDGRAVVVRLDRYRDDVEYTCVVELADGTIVEVGRWHPDDTDGAAWWTAPLPDDDDVAEVRLLVPDGSVWATA